MRRARLARCLAVAAEPACVLERTFERTSERMSERMSKRIHARISTHSGPRANAAVAA